MDILLTEVTRVIAYLSIPMWAAAAIGIGIATLLIRFRIVKKAWQKRLPVILVAAIGVYVLVFLVSGALLSRFSNKRLDAFRHQRIHPLLLQFADREIQIQDPKVVDDLLSIICEAQTVSAHQSHPADEIILSFPKAGYTYSLGKDSTGTDEFWLTWLSYPGSDPAIVSITVVKQFRSRALSEFLREHMPPTQSQNE